MNLEWIKKSDLSKTIVAVDFDGTCVTHEFPEVGEEVPGAVDVLKALSEAGAKLILWTMRSDIAAEIPIIGSPTETAVSAEYLSHAAQWFKERGITLHALNNNPQQSGWTSSPKCYAHIYIDDAALGCPLVWNKHDRPYVDWEAVCFLLARFCVAPKEL